MVAVALDDERITDFALPFFASPIAGRIDIQDSYMLDNYISSAACGSSSTPGVINYKMSIGRVGTS